MYSRLYQSERNDSQQIRKARMCARTPQKGLFLLPFLLVVLLLIPLTVSGGTEDPIYVITQVSGPSPAPASDTRQAPPTQAPPKQSIMIKNVKMILSGVNTLSSSAQTNWAQVTIDAIANQVGISLTEANVPFQVSLGMEFGSQEMISNGRLELIFSVTLHITSTLEVTQEQAESFVLQTFDSDTKKLNFITDLKNTQEFGFVNAVDVSVELAEPPPTIITVTIPPATSPPTAAPPTTTTTTTALPTSKPTVVTEEDDTLTSSTTAPPTVVSPTTTTTVSSPPEETTSSPTTSTLDSFTSPSPTTSPELHDFLVRGLIMTLVPMQPLDLVDTTIWEEETAAFLQREILVNHLNMQDFVQVVLDVTLQDPPFVQQESRFERQQLNLTFDATVSIKSQENNNAESYILSSFESSQARQDYIDLLKGTGYSAFSLLETVSVTTISQENSKTSEDTTTTSSPNNDNNMGVTIGITVALVLVGAAIVGFVVFYYVSKRRNPRHKRRADSPLSTAVCTHGDQHYYADEIEVGSRADVSTLGDPIPPGMRYGDVQEGGTLFTAATDTLSTDYDFTKQYHQSQLSHMDSTIGGDSESNLYVKDSHSLDQEYLRQNQFQVEAPAGLLGLVIDTSEEGLPTIRAIKDTSCLVGQVQVGDILLSVDSEDVTPMMASTVSRLISSKQHNSVRKFVFTRLDEGEA